MGGSRQNYFYNQDGENKNIGQVIYKSDVPKSSIGWTERSFFRDLGSSRNALDFKPNGKGVAFRSVQLSHVNENRLSFRQDFLNDKWPIGSYN